MLAATLAVAISATAVLAAPRVAVEPPIDSAAEAHAAVLALGTPFAAFAPVESARIGADSTYEVKGSEGGDAVWIVIYTFGWGDCQAGCIDRHSWAFQVDGRTGSSFYDSQMGAALPAEAPAALRAIDTTASGNIPAAWTVPFVVPVDGSPIPGASIDPTDYEQLYAQFLEELKATLSPCAEGVDTSDPMLPPCLLPNGSIAGQIPVFAPAPGPHEHAGNDGWIDALPAIILAVLLAWSAGAAFVGWRRSRAHHDA